MWKNEVQINRGVKASSQKVCCWKVQFSDFIQRRNTCVNGRFATILAQKISIYLSIYEKINSSTEYDKTMQKS